MSEYGEGYKSADRSAALYSTAQIRAIIDHLEMRVVSFDKPQYRKMLAENLEELQIRIGLIRKQLEVMEISNA